MDQFPPPGPPIPFHLRLVSAIASLALLDVAAGMYCYRLVVQGDGRGGISGSAVFFGTEVSAASRPEGGEQGGRRGRGARRETRNEEE